MVSLFEGNQTKINQIKWQFSNQKMYQFLDFGPLWEFFMIQNYKTVLVLWSLFGVVKKNDYTPIGRMTVIRIE